MLDFLTSIDVIAAISGVMALLFSIATLFVGLRRSKNQKESKSSAEKAKLMTLKVNGKKIEIDENEQEILKKVLNIKDGDLIFIERPDKESQHLQN